MSKREDTKMKWSITIDAMLIIGKYFVSKRDNVNVMKASKRYTKSVKMYHLNPITDC